MRKKNWIPEENFQLIKKHVPLCCVDIILIMNKKVLLVKRDINPYKGKWCLPGGIIKYGQKFDDKIQEIARDELGTQIKILKRLGFYEKIFSTRHDVTHCYVATPLSKKIQVNFQAKEARFFERIPKGISKFHEQILLDAGFTK